MRAAEALALALLLAVAPAAARSGIRSGAEESAGDAAGRALVRLACDNRQGGREMTLFANGTIRLRFEREGSREMKLAELTPDELAGFEARLAEEDLSEVEEEPSGAALGGAWSERCRLDLTLRALPERSFRFERLDSLSLPLARLVAVADELVREAERRAPGGGLPLHYEPQPGDILERADGVRFEVIGRTADGQGIELLGVEQPLTVFIREDALAEAFVRLVQRRRP